MNIFMRWLWMATFSVVLLSCNSKTGLTLSFSSANTPKFELSINEGQAFTKNLTIPVQISNSSNAVEMSITVGASCSENWTSFTESTTITVPSIDGTHIVSAKIRNVDGFESSCVQKQVSLDRTPPIFGQALQLEASRSYSSRLVSVRDPSISDAGSGVAKVELQLHKTTGHEILVPWTTRSSDQLFFELETPLPEDSNETYYYKVRAKDQLGNISEEQISPSFMVGPIARFAGGPEFSVDQRHAMAYVDVELSRPNTTSTTIGVKAVSNSAIAGIDILFPDIVPATVIVPAGQTSARFYFSILSSVLPGPEKNFKMQITHVTDALKANEDLTVRLQNNESPVSGTVASGYKKISIGHNRLCAIASDNSVECWGAIKNDFDMPNLVANATPIPGFSNIVSLAEGSAALHSCGLNSSGEIYCFGDSIYNQLGIDEHGVSNVGSEGFQASAVRVTNLSGVKQVATGQTFTCIINNNDQVQCWGRNNYYQVGAVSGTMHESPQTYFHVSKAIKIAAGRNHACAINETSPGDQKIQCWGWNYNSYSNGNTYFSNAHSLVSSGPSGIPTTFTDISVSEDTYDSSVVNKGERHGCAISSAGQVWCWGQSFGGKRGIPENYQTNSHEINLVTSAEVSSLIFTKVVAAASKTCALSSTGEVWCWGERVFSGQNLLQSNTPLKAPFTKQVIDFTMNESLFCALNVDTTIECLGVDIYGISGTGRSPLSYSSRPVNLGQPGEKFRQVVVTTDSSCALTEGGKVKCWGANQYGQLGLGHRNSILEPTATITFTGNPSIDKIVGYAHTYCALSSLGNVFCWGRNHDGQVGNGMGWSDAQQSRYYYQPIPYMIPTSELPAGVRDIAVGEGHVCAVLETQTIKCWGRALEGQTGHASYSNFNNTPTDIDTSLTNVTNIYAGSNSTCAVRTITGSSRELLCWGKSYANGKATNDHIPAVIETLPLDGELKVFVGVQAACFIHAGTTKCWGEVGGFTLPSFFSSLTPVEYPELANATSISLAYTRTGCATNATSGVKCWGDNRYTRVMPSSACIGSCSLAVITEMFELGTATNISIGHADSSNQARPFCAISSQGDLKCWGASPYGAGNNIGIIKTPTSLLR